MNPVVGLDVSKGESQVQAFLDKGKPYRKSFSIHHNLKGLGDLLLFLQEVERSAEGYQPSVVLESTGHYHAPVIKMLTLLIYNCENHYCAYGFIYVGL